MVSATLKSSQDALTFLGKMQESNDDTESFKKFKQDQNQKDVSWKQKRDSEGNK
jgi:hypothetical protein